MRQVRVDRKNVCGSRLRKDVFQVNSQLVVPVADSVLPDKPEEENEEGERDGDGKVDPDFR